MPLAGEQDAESLLEHPERYRDPGRGDLTIHLLARAIQAVQGNLTEQRLRSLKQLVAEVAKQQPEVAATTTFVVGNLERQLLAE